MYHYADAEAIIGGERAVMHATVDGVDEFDLEQQVRKLYEAEFRLRHGHLLCNPLQRVLEATRRVKRDISASAGIPL